MNTHIEIEVEASELKDALKAVVVATSKDKARPQLHQVRFEIKVGDGLPKLAIIATDGRRLHRAIICGCSGVVAGDGASAGVGIFHLSDSAARDLLKSVRKEGNARLKCDGTKVRCASGGIETSYQAIDDCEPSFPPYRRVIPDYAGELKAKRGKAHATKRYVLGVDARLMAEACKAAETMAGSGSKLATQVYFPTHELEPLCVYYSDGTSTFEAVVMPMRMD